MDLPQFAKWLIKHETPLQWNQHWIDGRWYPVRKSTQVKSSVNPNSGKVLVDAHCDRESINYAVESAFQTREEISKKSLTSRIDQLRQLRLALADYQSTVEWILRIEAGKPLWEARSDFENALHYLDYCIEHGDEVLARLKSPVHLHPFGEHEDADLKFLPLGVAAGYLPFSTPLTTFVFYLCATTVAGCPLILCTSSHAILFGIMIGLLLEHASAEGLGLSLLYSNFNGFKQILGDKRIATILYTGSREHCDVIRVESRHHVGRQLVLQSGGKNAVIVDSTADLKLAVHCVTEGALTTAGQRCTSTSRVFVSKSILEPFSAALVEAFKKVPTGRTDDPASKETDPLMGPLYSSKALDKYLRFQTMAHRDAARTLLWGKAIEGAPGFHVTPSVHYVTKFDNASAYQGNVLFAPDVAVYDFDTVDLAISQINTTDASFAVSFIGDPEILVKRRAQFLAPNLIVNGSTIETSATLPLAGRLQSGHHRYHGPGVAFYLCYPQILLRRQPGLSKTRLES